MALLPPEQQPKSEVCLKHVQGAHCCLDVGLENPLLDVFHSGLARSTDGGCGIIPRRADLPGHSQGKGTYLKV